MRLLHLLLPAVLLAVSPAAAHEGQCFASHEACALACTNPPLSSAATLRDCSVSSTVSGESSYCCKPSQCIDDGLLGEVCQTGHQDEPLCCTAGARCTPAGCVQQGNVVRRSADGAPGEDAAQVVEQHEDDGQAASQASSGPAVETTSAEHAARGSTSHESTLHHAAAEEEDESHDEPLAEPRSPPPAVVALLVKERQPHSVTLAWEPVEAEHPVEYIVRMTSPVHTQVYRGGDAEVRVAALNSMTEYQFDIRAAVAADEQVEEDGELDAVDEDKLLFAPHTATVTVETEPYGTREYFRSAILHSVHSSAETAKDTAAAIQNKVRAGLNMAKRSSKSSKSSNSDSSFLSLSSALFLFGGAGLLAAAFVIYRRQTAAGDEEILGAAGTSPLLGLGTDSDLFA